MKDNLKHLEVDPDTHKEISDIAHFSDRTIKATTADIISKGITLVINNEGDPHENK